MESQQTTRVWTRNSWSRMGSGRETKRRAHGPHVEQPEGLAELLVLRPQTVSIGLGK